MNLYRIEWRDASYDEQALYVVLADSPDQARALASAHAAGQAKPYKERPEEERSDLIGDADADMWLDPEVTTVTPVPFEAGVIAGHWHAG